MLYIWQTRNLLQNTSILRKPFSTEPSSSSSAKAGADRKQVLYQLICTNVLVIVLDIALLGIRYADMFYLQGAFKPCVYGVKLKVEYVVLNELIKSIQGRSGVNGHSGQGSRGGHSSSR